MGRKFYDPERRFWSKVDIKLEDECWNWLAGKNKDGYGKFSVKRVVRYRVWKHLM